MKNQKEIVARARELYRAERAIILSSWNVSAERGYVSRYPPGWFDDDLWNRCMKRAQVEARKPHWPEPLT